MSWASSHAVAAVSMIGTVLLHGTALALVAWLLSATLLRRARPATLAVLWTIVLAKFVVPVGPAMPWSISDLVASFATSSSAAPVVVAAAATPTAAGSSSPSLAALLALAGLAIWAAVAAGLLVAAIRRTRSVAAAARRLPLAQTAVSMLAAEIAHRLGLRRTVEVRIGGAQAHVVGSRRPTIVIPEALVTERSRLAAILAHEIAHVRRRDSLLRVLQLVATALFFFWPVIHWVNRRVDLAREMACDDWALAQSSVSQHDYARLLCSAAALGRAQPILGLAAARGQLRQRVDALLRPRRHPPAIGAQGRIGLAAWAVLALTGASSSATGRTADCVFTPELAKGLLAAFPTADADGDGVLSRDEACELQSEMRRRGDEPLVSAEGEALDVAGAVSMLEEPLCCNCQGVEGTSSLPANPPRALAPNDLCVRGVEP